MNNDLKGTQRVPTERFEDVYEADSDAARDSLKKGVDLVANLVKNTLGPKGRPVLLCHGRQHRLTYDGVTVARMTSFQNATDNAAATVVKEVCEETVDAVGDGTTTAIVVAQAIIKFGIERLKANKLNPVMVKEGIDKTTKNVIKFLNELAEPIIDDEGVINMERLLHVATVSCNGDVALGQLITQAVGAVGIHGFVSVIEGKNSKTTIELTKGIQYPMGLKGSAYAYDEGGISTTYNNPYILIAQLTLQLSKSLELIMEMCAKTDQPLVIIAYGVTEEADAYIQANVARKAVKVTVANPPHFGDYKDDVMEDIAIMCNAMVVKSCLSDKSIPINMLGRCQRFVGEENKTSITAIEKYTQTARYKERIDHLAAKKVTHVNDEDYLAYVKRYSQFTDGCAEITVGATTPLEMKEKYDRVDDAQLACKTALRGGILPGGGFAYIHVVRNYIEWCESNDIAYFGEDHEDKSGSCGERIVLDAIVVPFMQIMANCGLQGETILANCSAVSAEFGMGYNARTDKMVNLIADGVIDPAHVATTALDKAASIAGTTLTIGGLLIKDSY